MTLLNKRIGFIGSGAMASALMTGIVKAGLVKPEQVWASDINPQSLLKLAENLQITTCTDNKQLVQQADIIICAVKPMVVAEVLEEVGGLFRTDQLLISIAAGVTTNDIEAATVLSVPVIRVMPNTPSLVSAGATAISLGKFATIEHEQIATAIFEAVGKAVTVKEQLMDSVTGLSGSGPAYVYIMLEALSDAGVKVGLPRDVATSLAAQTVFGAAKMVLETGEHPGKLKDMVTTPGGTTIAGVYALEEGNLRATMMNAVIAATQRSQEMSSGKK